MKHIVRAIGLAALSVAFLAGCAGKQIRQDQKDNFNLQMQAYIANAASANKVAEAAVKVCETDANPGLCVNMALGQIKSGTGPVPQAPAPYVSPAARMFQASLGTLNTGLNLWAGNLRDKNIISMLETVGQSAGNHVQGDFINGWQDNSNNSDNHVDNSVAVGGNLGDTYGDGFTGGDRHETSNEFSGSGPVIVDSTDTNVGDNNENSGNIGEDNRQDSYGPIDNSDDGDDCSGESCVEVPTDPDPAT